MTRRCITDGCDTPVRCKGLCEKHYRIARKVEPTNPCACGCGGRALRNFINGHNTRLLPSDEQARRGTYSGESRRGTGTGYVKLHQRHAHRVVAEVVIGRKLLPGEVVHHIDGDKSNNAPENLEVLTQAEHTRRHHAEMLAARKAKRGW